MDIDGYISQEIMTSISSYPAKFLPVITHTFFLMDVSQNLRIWKDQIVSMQLVVELSGYIIVYVRK